MKRHLLAALLAALAGCRDSGRLPRHPAGADTLPVTSAVPRAIQLLRGGRDLAENGRRDDAARAFQAALELDPDFPLARAWLGFVTPGGAGLEALRAALQAADDRQLADMERIEIELLLRLREGRLDRALGLAETLCRAAPRDWRAQGWRAQLELRERHPAAAEEAARAALALDPQAAAAWNTLGYALLEQEKAGDAAAAFRRYAQLLPTEPKPRDSLGEALLAAGRLYQAEASFRKALDLAPGFVEAWTGIATARFLRGDSSGGRAALGRMRAAATAPWDKLRARELVAWSYMADGRVGDALVELDGLEDAALAAGQGDWHAVAALTRAVFNSESGHDEAAIALAREAEARAGRALPPAAAAVLQRDALGWELWSEVRLGELESAKATYALVERHARDASSDGELASRLAFARGALAWGEGDLGGAVKAFSACARDDVYCRWQYARALDQNGDAAAARVELDRIAGFARRDPFYLYVRARIRAERKAPRPPSPVTRVQPGF